MTKSLKTPEHAEGVVVAGVAALLHWNKDTNAEATEEMRSGRLVADSEHEDVRVEVEAAAALHLNGEALAGTTESEHAAGRLVVEAAAAEAVHHLDTNMNAAATDSQHEEGRLDAEAAEAAAALDLCRSRKRTHTKRPAKETIRSDVSLRSGETPRKEKNHKLKELSKRIRNASGTEKERTDTNIYNRFLKNSEASKVYRG